MDSTLQNEGKDNVNSSSADVKTSSSTPVPNIKEKRSDRKCGITAGDVRRLALKHLVPPIFVPRELLPLIALGLVVAIGVPLTICTIVRAGLHRRWMKPRRFSSSGADAWVLDLNKGRTGYFIDIGATGPKRHVSNTRILEEHGWTGLCADPVPRDWMKRECGFVPRPIGARTGDHVKTKDCWAADDRAIGDRACTEAQVTTIGIDKLLHMAEAPKVIDYISISSRNSGRSIVSSFPWHRFCARAWTIELTNGAGEAEELQQIFGQHHCRMASGFADFWAECPCKVHD